MSSEFIINSYSHDCMKKDCTELFKTSCKALYDSIHEKYKTPAVYRETECYVMFLFDFLFYNNPNRVILYEALINELLTKYGRDITETLKSRIELYAKILSGKIEPRFEFCLSLPDFEINKLQKTFFAFGDIVYNPICASDYFNAPFKVIDIYDTNNYFEHFLTETLHTVNKIKNSIEAKDELYKNKTTEETEGTLTRCPTTVMNLELAALKSEVRDIKKQLDVLNHTHLEYDFSSDKMVKRVIKSELNPLLEDADSKKYQKQQQQRRRRTVFAFIISIVLCCCITVFAMLEIDEYLHSQNPVTMTVTIKTTCRTNAHVGDSWSGVFKVDKRSVDPEQKTSIQVWQRKTITLDSAIFEADNIEDTGNEKTKYRITEKDLRKGFKIKQTVYVTENRGRYAGSTAEWLVTWTFSPLR